jgi:hypothetical protein
VGRDKREQITWFEWFILIVVPGFFYQYYTRILEDGEDFYKPIGTGKGILYQ